jgi:hypothetical protein
VTLYTKEGYRLEGLLIFTTDSQLVIYPGKFKEWKKKINYKLIYFHFSKIEKLQMKKCGCCQGKSSGEGYKNRMFSINGNIGMFHLFRKSLSKQLISVS